MILSRRISPFLLRSFRRGAAVFVLAAALPACSSDEPETSLPDMPVYAHLSLDDAQYTRLQNLGEFLEITEPRGAFTRIGVRGLLIIHSITPMDSSRPFAAYDLACPYCYTHSNHSPRPRVYAQEGGVSAVCEECGSRYDISSGFGGCVEGPGTQLQVYPTYYSAASRVLLVQD